MFCFGALEASQKRDVVKSSAATACLFHTKHNSGCIFIGKLGPTHEDVQTGAVAAGLRSRGTAEQSPAPPASRRCPPKVIPLPCQLQEEQRLVLIGGGEKKQLCSHSGPRSSVSGQVLEESWLRLRKLAGNFGDCFLHFTWGRGGLCCVSRRACALPCTIDRRWV